VFVDWISYVHPEGLFQIVAMTTSRGSFLPDRARLAAYGQIDPFPHLDQVLADATVGKRDLKVA
jgi:hypothetical protein